MIRTLHLGYVKTYYSSLKKKEREPGFSNEHFSKEDIQTANKHMERFSISLVNRKLQIKSKMRYHFTPTEMARINRSDNNRG